MHMLCLYLLPEVKQVEVICHLMHADFSRTFFYTFGWGGEWSMESMGFHISRLWCV